MSHQPLPSGGVRALIRTFARNDDYGHPPPPLTGKIALLDGDRSAGIYFSEGRIYAAELEKFEPSMALRLLSTGKIGEDMFFDINSLENADVSKVAVQKGYVTSDLVEEINRQNIFSVITHLYEWKNALWGWQDGKTTQRFTMTPLESTLVVTAADERVGQWNALLRNFPTATMPETVLLPGPDWGSKAGQSTTPEIASILRYIDAERSLGEIALLCGFSRFEMGARVAKAVADGLIELPGSEAHAPQDLADEMTAPEVLPEYEEELDWTTGPSSVEEARLAMEQALTFYNEAKERYEKLASQQ